MADGWITIGTELATDKFDKQIVELEKKIQKEENKKLIIETQLSNQEQELITARKRVDELADAYEKLKQVQKAIDTGKATPQQFMMASELQNTYGTLDKIGTSFDRALDKQIAIEQRIEKTKNQYSEINQKVEEYKQKINSINIQKQKTDVDRLKGSIDKVGSSLNKSVKTAGKLALGIFGIRSAYLALRRASSDLANYDEQYATNLEYIRFALTQAIAPVLRYIVNLAATLLGYINAIAQAWFGVNLFANGSVEAFNKMKKNASGVGKAVKEIKKQLLGFDEINVLTDQSDTGTSAGAGGIAPNFDLSGIQGDRPEWLQWIIDNKDTAIRALEGIGTALLSIKFGLGGIKGIGLFLIIDGIRQFIEDINDFTNNPTVQKFGEILQDIGEALIGIGIVLGGTFGMVTAIVGQIFTIVGGTITYIKNLIDFFNDPSWEKWIETWRSGIRAMGIVGIVADWLIDLIVNNVFGGWDEITKLLETVVTWIYTNVIKPIQDFFQPLIDFVVSSVTNLWNSIKGILDIAWQNIKVVIDNVKQIFTVLWDNLKRIFAPVAEFFGNIFGQAFERIKNVFNSITSFFSGIWSKIVNIFAPIGQKIGEIVGGAFKTVINGILSKVENVLNTPIRAINKLTSVINQVPGINLGYLSTFSLPRLKTGGIINMPNTGTMIGGAIAGESGREGVVPLTDRQAMEELGRTIGKYITVNANITNTMNGRVISRELKQVQSEQNFAYNT